MPLRENSLWCVADGVPLAFLEKQLGGQGRQKWRDPPEDSEEKSYMIRLRF